MQTTLKKAILLKLKNSPPAEIISRCQEIYNVFDRRGKKLILFLYANRAVTTVMQTINMFGLAALFLILAKPNMVMRHPYFARIYEFSGIENKEAILVILCGFVVAIAILHKILTLLSSLFDIRIKEGLVRRTIIMMQIHYTTLPYETLVREGIATTLTKSVSLASNLVPVELQKGALLFSVLVNLTLVLILMFSISLLATSLTLAILFVSFFLFFIHYRIRTNLLGEEDYKNHVNKVRTLKESSSAMIELKTMGKENEYMGNLQKILRSMAQNKVKHALIEKIPNFILFLIAILLLYLTAATIILNNHTQILPKLVLFSVAAFRMLRMGQSLFQTFVQQEHSRYKYQIIIKELKQARKTIDHRQNSCQKKPSPIRIRDSVVFDSVSYSYPNTNSPAIHGLNVTLPTKKIIVLFGDSGVGKSTFTRLLSGILIPRSGKILVDGKSLHEDEDFKRDWQISLGISFQKPFFMNANLALNIAFVSEEKKIDYPRIHEVIKLAQLEELVAELPDGIDTELAENAETLSGGQRQRIAIARVLYQDAPILVLDEATNAIDLATERKIISNLVDATPDKLIVIISHRIEIMELADIIVFMKKDKSVVQGAMGQLMQEDKDFKSIMLDLSTKAP